MHRRRTWLPASIRARFLIATGTAFCIMLTSGISHLVMAGIASRADATAQASQARTAVYMQMVLQARELQSATVSDDGRSTLGKDLPQTREGMIRLVREASRLPLPDQPDRRQSAVYIQEAAARLLSSSRDPETIHQDMLRIFRHRPRSYRVEINTVLAPFIDFEQRVGSEIRATNAIAKNALARAAYLTRLLAGLAMATLLAGIAVMGLAMQLILRRLRTGIDHLEHGTRVIAESRFEHRSDIGGGDELTRLGYALDELAHQLGEKQQVIDSAQGQLEAAVRARTAELERANEELAQADQRRRAFFADIGHELRTPLTLIRGEAQLWLRQDEARRMDPAHAFGRILEFVHGLTRLVDDLFLIARAESNALGLSIVSFDLRDMLLQAAEDFTAIAQDRDCAVAVTEGPRIIVAADRDRLRQLLFIFLDNGTVHGGARVTVTLGAEVEAGGVVLQIADDGSGIPVELRATLFSRFGRGGKSGGSGLGLTVACAIVQAHGGTISVTPGAPGGGAAFRIVLPIAVAPATQVAA